MTPTDPRQLSLLDRIAETAAAELVQAYWTSCDQERRAIDPAELTDATWAQELLAEQYELALRAEDDPMGWSEGRSKV